MAQQPITYQGQLNQSGAPYTGQADLEFRLYDSLSDGSQVGSTVLRPDWPVEDGLFQVELDFGAAYGSAPRWLEVTVDGNTLSPRQALRPAPVALFALSGSDWQLVGSDVHYSAGNVGIGTSAPAAPLEIRSNSAIATPQLLLNEAEDDFARLTLGNEVSSRFWTIAGLTRGATSNEDRLNFYNNSLGNLLTLSGSGDGTVGIRISDPSSAFALDVNGGALIRRDNDGTSLPHLHLFEPAGEDPIRMYWRHAAATRYWTLSALSQSAGAGLDRFALDNSGSGNMLSILGNGRTGIGMEPVSRLTVRSDGQWNPSAGDGRGDFYVGDGGVGLSIGVALGGGGRGVTRLWTGGGVEHMFLGSAAYGTSLSVLPGQIGINNTNPGNTLDVDGGVRIRDLAHAGTDSVGLMVAPSGDLVSATEVTRTYTIAPTALHPAEDGFDFRIGNIARINSGTGSLVAPIDLPHGAIISEMRMWFRDNSSAAIQFRICRTSFLDGLCYVQNDFNTSGATTGFRQEVITSFLGGSDLVIDTSTGAYSLIVTSSGWDGSNTEVAGVQFVYTAP